MSTERALGPNVWARKAARLPSRGTLLVATDLQGNLRDYERLKQLYDEEESAGNEPILAFCGDLVHGPSPDLQVEDAWPEHLGTQYVDESKALILDFDEVTRERRIFSLLGNHEHAHIGGPVVSKFHLDEARELEKALGDQTVRVQELLNSFPLIAVADCGIVLTHGAPAGTEFSLEAFESLSYLGFSQLTMNDMYRRGTVGALLWARMASADQARALLRATSEGDEPHGLVLYGHDVVREGYEKVGDEQLCFSTSYGLFDEHKVYVRIDLASRYRSVHDLREGVEIRRLYDPV